MENVNNLDFECCEPEDRRTHTTALSVLSGAPVLGWKKTTTDKYDGDKFMYKFLHRSIYELLFRWTELWMYV